MRTLSILYFLFIGFFGFSQFSPEQQIIRDFLKDESLQNSPISISLVNLDNEQEILSFNSRMSIIPASVQKLLTSGAALQILGADYKFTTTIAYTGELRGGTLDGDLIILGGGDPSLGSNYFQRYRNSSFLTSWARKIKEYGIDSINGNIIADRSIYSDQDVPQTWIWEDLGNYFGAAAQGISLYDNTFEIVFSTENRNGGSTEIIGTDPFIPGISFENMVKASNDPRDQAYVYGSPFNSYREIKGTLPKGRSKFTIKASIPNPAALLAYQLSQALYLEGVQIAGHDIYTDDRSLLLSETIFQWESPDLAELIKVLNHESHNLIAEHLVKQVSLIKTGEASTSEGLKVIKQFWKSQGIDTSFLFLADGSGLSRANAISAASLTDILRYMNTGKDANIFTRSIPLTGTQGTQRYYFQDSPLKGKVRAKSGSMTRVRSFAGYMTSEKGTKLAFAIIVNNFNAGSFTTASKLEKLMETIYFNL